MIDEKPVLTRTAIAKMKYNTVCSMHLLIYVFLKKQVALCYLLLKYTNTIVRQNLH